jgi:tRNA G26 N,N-dimethylase Trm1
MKTVRNMVKNKAYNTEAKDKIYADKGVRILEALSATGLRSIRYWKEISGLHQIIANDLDPNAVELIKSNVIHNGISTDKIVPNQADASYYLELLISLIHTTTEPTYINTKDMEIDLKL